MIYVVEDDAEIREMEVYTLKSTGFEAEGFEDGSAFFNALKKNRPELILLDVMLPKQDGISILKELRRSADTKNIPVIMATAKGAEYDRISGLDLGADDYLVKPFGMMEMAARVKAVLRRTANDHDETFLQYGRLCMDTEKHTVIADRQNVILTLKEFEILHLLLKNPGTVFTRDRLLSSVWGTEYDQETRTVDVHIRTLRAKLGSCAEMIQTVRGVGYRLSGDPL